MGLHLASMECHPGVTASPHQQERYSLPPAGRAQQVQVLVQSAHPHVSTEYSIPCSNIHASVKAEASNNLCCNASSHASYQDLCCVQPAPDVSYREKQCNLDQDRHDSLKHAHKRSTYLRWTSTPHTRNCLSYTFASFSVSSWLPMLEGRSAQVYSPQPTLSRR